MKIWRLISLLIVLVGTMASVQGCAFLAGAATGAAGAEVAEEEGYELDSPIEKDDDDK